MPRGDDGSGQAFKQGKPEAGSVFRERSVKLGSLARCSGSFHLRREPTTEHHDGPVPRQIVKGIGHDHAGQDRRKPPDGQIRLAHGSPALLRLGEAVTSSIPHQGR
jgi:hypothetical protein